MLDSVTEDLLWWVFSSSGIYTPKAGYSNLIEQRLRINVEWWWKPLMLNGGGSLYGNCPVLQNLGCLCGVF